MRQTIIAIGLTLAMAAPAAGAIHPTYAAALAAQAKSGRPLVVIVGAVWCPSCVRMKKELGAVQRAGTFRDVELVQIDFDKQRALSMAITKGSSRLPVVAVYWKKNGVHQRRAADAYHNGARYRQLINQAYK